MELQLTPLQTPRLSRLSVGCILFDRAGLDGLEVAETSWDEWSLWADVQGMPHGGTAAFNL